MSAPNSVDDSRPFPSPRLDLIEANKENLCSIPPEDEEHGPCKPIPCKDTPTSTADASSRQKKPGKCNMRKSLAWNEAFFTEEGVLDHAELSILSGSGAGDDRRGASLASLSPFSQSTGTPGALSARRKTYCEGSLRRERKDERARQLFVKTDTPKCEEKEKRVSKVSSRIPVAKGVSRSLPQTPAAYSQKRVENTTTANMPSKIPKCMPIKAHTTVPTINVMSTTKDYKSRQSVIPANHNIGSSACRKDSICASTTVKNYLHDTCSQMVGNLASNTKPVLNQSISPMLYGEKRHLSEGPSALTDVVGDLGSSMKPVLNQSISPKLYSEKRRLSECPSSLTDEVGNLDSSMKPALNPSISTKLYGEKRRFSEAPSIITHARPSALRVPSPSLAFFSQGKVSPSHADQSKRNIVSPVSCIPLRKDTNLSGLKLQTMFNGIGPTTCTAAKISSSDDTFSGNIQISSEVNCAASSAATLVMHKDPEKDVEMKKMDTEPRKSYSDLTNSHCQMNSQYSFSTDSLDCEHSHKSILGKFHSSKLGEVPCHSNNSHQSSEVFFHENKLIGESQNDVDPENASNDKNPKLNPCITAIPLPNNSTNLPSQDSPEKCYLKYKESDSVSNYDTENIHFEDAECISSAVVEPSLTSSKEGNLPSSPGNLKKECFVVDNEASSPIGTEIPECTRDMSGTFSTQLEDKEPQGCAVHFTLMPEMNRTTDDVSNVNETLITNKLDPDLSDLHQLSASPFTEEWFAALETFGEDVLKLKTGRVQNSPTEKVPLEPGPWSPVKQKAQSIGPFDCTKFYKNVSASASSSASASDIH